MAIDPVCGMTVDEQFAATTSVHNGTTYYFCSAPCGAKFAAAPAGYSRKTGPTTPLKHANAKEARNLPYRIWATLTFITCPCCIPIWVFLLSGTAAGAVLTRNIYLTVVAFLIPFLFFAWKALRSHR